MLLVRQLKTAGFRLISRYKCIVPGSQGVELPPVLSAFCFI